MSNPKLTFANALKDLEGESVQIVARSGLWQSRAWPPGTDAPDYLNMVVETAFDGKPHELLRILNRVEAHYGRVRSEKNAPRTLDLDILDFEGQVIETPDLTLPHPRMLEREFVLFPLVEIAPEWRDPVSGHDVWHFLGSLDQDVVSKLKYAGVLSSRNREAISGISASKDC